MNLSLLKNTTHKPIDDGPDTSRKLGLYFNFIQFCLYKIFLDIELSFSDKLKGESSVSDKIEG